VTFRARLLFAFALATVIPLAMLAFGVRRKLTERLVAQKDQRIEALRQIAAQDIAREARSIASRLATLAATLRTDDRFRLAAVRGDAGERAYVLDWAGNAMRTSGLDMLQLQDSAGRILSSGHFRNEFDRLEPALPRSLTRARGAVLVNVRAPDGPFLTLARIDSAQIAGQTFTLVGGIKVDSAFLQRLVRDEGVVLRLATGDTVVVPRLGSDPNADDDLTTRIPLAYMLTDSGQLTSAQLLVSYTIPELAALRRDVDSWFVASIAVVVVAALGLAFWLSRRMSDPLATLTQAASTIELEGPELTLAATRDDEIGTLARRMGSMSRRLRLSAARLQQAERRATVGDMARQVNHDIKNGLIPIRNVLRHLSQVQEQQPQELATVFAERRSTLESSVGYLDTLARNYARLTPRVDSRAVDVNEIVTELVASTGAPASVKVRARLAEPKPRALGDPVVVRRILDNLVRNAVESFDPAGGEVTITTSSPTTGGVRIVVDDTGRGMTDEQLARAFDVFYTTKSDGTGLGLSVVRRLTTDLNGAVRVQSAPGKGTTFTIDLPACTLS
jgi:signal transduction histidine kinase